jgi:hypothetical protein
MGRTEESRGVLVPVAAELMESLKEKYGEKKGRSVYYAMENKCKTCGREKGKDCPKYCDPILRAIQGKD